MFILAQLWIYFLAATLLGALATWMLSRVCTPSSEGAPKPRSSDAAGPLQTRQMEVSLNERDAMLTHLHEQLALREREALEHRGRLDTATQEIEVLRLQVTQGRSELARVLNQRDVDNDALSVELAATRQAFALNSAQSG